MSLFITFEGPEGSGKTTQAKLLTDYLTGEGYTVNQTREPGGTSIGELIRDILLDPGHKNMNPRTELFLYLATRAQHIAERIRPALKRGEIVICDRFSDASVVYQGMARKLGVEQIKELNEYATENLLPDITFIMDVPVKEGLSEARNSSSPKWNTTSGDRIEQEGDDFHRIIRSGYRKLAQEEPERCKLLSRRDTIEETQQIIQQTVREWLRHREG
ncbi:MAG: dTMP kinase [bacterium]